VGAGQYAAAAEHARKAADGSPGDALAAMLHAQCLLRSDDARDGPRALKAVEAVIERLQRAGQAVPGALYNSAALVAMRPASSRTGSTRRNATAPAAASESCAPSDATRVKSGASNRTAGGSARR
jgi:hypothetical protein